MKHFYSIPFFTLACIGSTFAQAKTKNLDKKNTKKTAISYNIRTDFLRTNNKDTLYFDLENTLIITPSEDKKNTKFIIETTNGKLNKLGKNFYTLGDLTENTVTVFIMEESSGKKIFEKKFIVAKQVLPF